MMSSKSPVNNFVRIEIIEEDDFDLKRVIIPFSLFFQKDECLIDKECEKIPFHKRDPIYQTILLQEFSESRRSKD